MRRPVPLILLSLLLILQLQLWFGRGSIPDVWRLRQQHNTQLQLNAQAEQSNERLRANCATCAMVWKWWKNGRGLKSAWSSPTKFLCKSPSKP